jgi:hypothetical protein
MSPHDLYDGDFVFCLYRKDLAVSQSSILYKVNKTGALVQPLLQLKKKISIIYCECVFVAFGIQHAMHMRRIIIDGQSGSTTFFHIITKKARLSKKN